jgi:hypothetical protein
MKYRLQGINRGKLPDYYFSMKYALSPGNM